MYPLEPNLVALGLVVGLDYRQTTLDVHQLLQKLKTAPMIREYLEGGEMVEWGAKTIPEGGYYSLGDRRAGEGVMIVGDSAGFVEVASLKGIHYAMQSGMFAARAAFDALKAGDFSRPMLEAYDNAVDQSVIVRDLYRRRNMRLAFKDGFYVGGLKATLMTLTNGAFPGGATKVEAVASEPARVVARGRIRARRQAHLPQARRSLQVRKQNARRHPVPPDCRRGHSARGRVALRAHVSRWCV